MTETQWRDDEELFAKTDFAWHLLVLRSAHNLTSLKPIKSAIYFIERRGETKRIHGHYFKWRYYPNKNDFMLSIFTNNGGGVPCIGIQENFIEAIRWYDNGLIFSAEKRENGSHITTKWDAENEIKSQHWDDWKSLVEFKIKMCRNEDDPEVVKRAMMITARNHRIRELNKAFNASIKSAKSAITKGAAPAKCPF